MLREVLCRDGLGPVWPTGRDARLAAEEALLDVGRSDLAAGRCIPDAALDDWLERWVRGDHVRLPASAA